MVSILDELSKVTPGNDRGEFVVFGNNIAELMEASTSNLVVKKAAELGFNRPGISNAGGPYPVDEAGATDDDLLLGKRGPVAGYRRDFVVLSSL